MSTKPLRVNHYSYSTRERSQQIAHLESIFDIENLEEVLADGGVRVDRGATDSVITLTIHCVVANDQADLLVNPDLRSEPMTQDMWDAARDKGADIYRRLP